MALTGRSPSSEFPVGSFCLASRPCKRRPRDLYQAVVQVQSTSVCVCACACACACAAMAHSGISTEEFFCSLYVLFFPCSYWPMHGLPSCFVSIHLPTHMYIMSRADVCIVQCAALRSWPGDPSPLAWSGRPRQGSPYKLYSRDIEQKGFTTCLDSNLCYPCVVCVTRRLLKQFVCAGFGKFWNFENLIPGPRKVWNLEFGFWKSFGLLEIHCQTACTVQCTYNLVGWPWKLLVLFCPVRSVLGWEWVLVKGFGKVLEFG